MGDGGIWRGTVNGSPPNDAIQSRNGNLRTFQFFDLDYSASDTDLMAGGTQDNGTLVFQGQPAWRQIRDGDGAFTLISRQTNQRIYSQEQYLTSTKRSDNGAAGGGWLAIGDQLPSGDDWYVSSAFMTIDPANGNHLLSEGPEVYETYNAGGLWLPVGPKGAGVKGYPHRIAFRPGGGSSACAVGTSEGQVWLRSSGGSWSLLFEHPQNKQVSSISFAPTSNKLLYVLFDGGSAYMRLWRLEEGSPGNWSLYNITDTLPANAHLQVVCGDSYSSDIAFVGTAAGIYRGDGQTGWWNWTPYNDGLPLVPIADLLVDPTSKQLRAATWGRGVWAVITGP
jgi:hypothetical protein